MENIAEKKPKNISATDKRTISTQQMTLTGVMTAVTCIIGPFVFPLPISPVPISLTNLVIYFALYLLGSKLGTASYLIYLLLGFAGLPVFSGFTGGVGKLAGPTGGYLVGFIIMAVISGYFIDRFPKQKFVQISGMVLGTAVCYIFGTFWLSKQLGISFIAGLGVGVFPYLPGDAIKIALAAIAGPKLKKRVLRAAGR